MATEKVPELLGSAMRAQMLAAALHGLQLQRADLEVQQIANGEGGGDPCRVTDPTGRVMTYDARFAQIAEAEQRLLTQSDKAVVAAVRKQAEENPPA